MKTFKKVIAADVKKATADLKMHTNGARVLINDWIPVIVAGVHAGDNVAPLNGFLRASGPVTQRRLGKLVAEWCPNEYNRETMQFGKKLPANVVAKKETKFREFIALGRKVMTQLEQERKTEEKDVDPAAVIARDLKKAERILSQCLNDGVTVPALMQLFRKVVEERGNVEAEAPALAAVANG